MSETTKRKAISNTIRFEIFKRDSFKCQYCGRSAPDIILEVDHINPIANGGDDDPTNLITSCFDCNRGKGKKLLSDNDMISKQREQLEELNIRREQLEMMLQWRTDLKSLGDQQASFAVESIKDLTGQILSDYGKNQIAINIKKYGLEEVLKAIEIAFTQYYKTGRPNTFSAAFDKIGGICFNRKKQATDPSYEWKMKLLYKIRRKFGEDFDDEAKALVLPHVAEFTFVPICEILEKSSDFNDLYNSVDYYMYTLKEGEK